MVPPKNKQEHMNQPCMALTTRGHADMFSRTNLTHNLHTILVTTMEKFKILHKTTNTATMLNTSSNQEFAKFYQQSVGLPLNLANVHVLAQHPGELLACFRNE